MPQLTLPWACGAATCSRRLTAFQRTSAPSRLPPTHFPHRHPQGATPIWLSTVVGRLMSVSLSAANLPPCNLPAVICNKSLPNTGKVTMTFSNPSDVSRKISAEKLEISGNFPLIFPENFRHFFLFLDLTLIFACTFLTWILWWNKP